MLTGWENAGVIQITCPARAEQLTDFPLQLYITGEYLAEIIGTLGESSRKIALEIEQSGVQAPVEVVSWSPDIVILTVKVTLLTSTRTMYLYYDPDHADNTDHVGAIGSTAGQAVWGTDIYTAVYHLSQDPAGTVRDSTANALDLTPSGNPTRIQDDLFGYGIGFDGADDKLVSAASNLSDLQSAVTVECIADAVTARDSQKFVMIGADTTGGLQLSRYGTTAYLNAGLGAYAVLSNVNIVNGIIKQYGLICSSNVFKCFGNGVIDTVSSTHPVASLSSARIAISNNNGSAYFQSKQYRVRISKVELSQNWLMASYLADMNQLLSFSYPCHLTGPNIANAPLNRRIVAFDRESLAVYGSIESDAETGAWQIDGLPRKQMAIAAFDDTGVVDAEIHDGVTPGIA